jgi:DNA-binding GntR family transcriptional regulator
MEFGKKNVIETRSLGEQIYNHLCNQIIEGAVNYGECLNIKLIAKELGVSPMPVREAIKRLETENMVFIKPRSTCLIQIPTKESILNALDMRELIEIHCVRTVYPGTTQAKLEPLASIIRRMGTIVKSGSNPEAVKEYIKCDRQFHIELCKLACNAFIDKFYREIGLHLNMNFIYDIAIPPDIIGTYHQHEDLVNLLARNSEESVSVIMKHLQRSRQNVLSGRLFSTLQNAPKKDS